MNNEQRGDEATGPNPDYSWWVANVKGEGEWSGPTEQVVVDCAIAALVRASEDTGV